MSNQRTITLLRSHLFN